MTEVKVFQNGGCYWVRSVESLYPPTPSLKQVAELLELLDAQSVEYRLERKGTEQQYRHAVMRAIEIVRSEREKLRIELRGAGGIILTPRAARQ